MSRTQSRITTCQRLRTEALEPRHMLATTGVMGDANADGIFDQHDLVQLLASGKYLAADGAHAHEGDFDCNGRFDQFDLIAALQKGRYTPTDQLGTKQGGRPLAEGESRTVATFNAMNAELAEGVAVDKQGNIFVTLAPRGEIWRITPDGQRSLLAEFATNPASPLPGALGLAVDATGNVYAALATGVPASHGVWRVSPDGQTKERLPGTESIVFPNSVALDNQMRVFVTDSAQGAVWRVPPGGPAELWIQNPLLEPNLELSPVGANGIAIWRGSLLVANSSKFSIVRIPIENDGTAGAANVLFQGEFGFFPDGIALGAHGNIYVANPVAGVVHRIAVDDLSLTVIATATEGLDDPTSLAFGTGMGSRQSVLVANSSFFGVEAGPAIVEVGVGEPGLPLP